MECIAQFFIGLIAIATLLLVILLPLSYSDLEYYEMGFTKSKTTGSVDTSKVYFGGRHFVGVTTTFKTFRKDVHNEKFDRLTIYNKEKIEVTMTCSVQYELRSEDLALLHDTYDVAYKPIIRSTVLAAIKGEANKYTIEQYRANRPFVAKGLADAAANALGGKCCRKDCVVCRTGCKSYTSCTKDDKGLFAHMKYFQLQLVDITEEQQKTFLRQVLEQEKTDTEHFVQKELITRKQTEQERIAVENLAREVEQGANANSSLIVSRATIQAKALVDDARSQGLKIIHDALNITSEEHKKTLDYIRTLRDSKNANMYIGFQYMVARP